MKPRPPNKDYPLLPGFGPLPEAQPQAEVIEPAANPQPVRKSAGRKVVLIHHQQNGVLIEQRPTDGYVNATAMCRAYGKPFAHYMEIGTHKEFLTELGLTIDIPIVKLVQSRSGRYGGGTWVHPRVAPHLAQWLSPAFSVAVTGWILDWIEGRLPRPKDECFEVRQLLERLAESQNRLAAGQEAENRQLAQMQRMNAESWMALIHLAYPGSTRTDDVTPPPWTGKRQLSGPTPPPTGRPKLVEPRRGFAPNPNFRKGYS